MLEILEKTRACRDCLLEKSLDEFHASKNGTFGKASYCKMCMNIRTRIWRETNREKMQEVARISYFNRTLEKYNLTQDEYRDLLSSQKGLCAICYQPPTEKRYQTSRPLCIDHDHKTGQVRGLLCGSCNRALGGFKDNPSVLESAKQYLTRYSR